MSTLPTILHADVDAFFAAVEQRDDPALRGRPVAVGGGVVMAASYEARAFGVRGAMSGSKARRLCPDLVVVRPRFDAYVAASRAVFAVFRETAPVVEGLSLEEAFLDVAGLERISGTAPEIAVRLRRDVRERVGLAVTVGVARTKLLAKLASRAAKPDGLLVVAPEDEVAFLHSRRVEDMWGIGRRTARRLHAHGLRTVADLARHDEATLVALLGPATGRRMHALAHDRERRPVRANRRRRRSVGAQCGFGRTARAPQSLDPVLAALADRVSRRMRRAGWTGRTIVLRLRFDDFTRATRSRTLAEATAASRGILSALRALLAEAMPSIERQGVTLVGVTVTNLADVRRGIQLGLPIGDGGGEALDAAIDEVRERFGTGAVTRAVQLGYDPAASNDQLSDM